MLSVVELEAVAARGWRGTSVRALGDWLLRAAGGFTSRANSVLPLGSPGVALDAALRTVDEFYAEHGLPARFQMPEDATGSGSALLENSLVARGWQPYTPVSVMTAPISSVLIGCPARADLPPAALETTPSAAWLAGYLYRGTPLPPGAIDVLVNATSPVFASIPGESTEPRGVARGVITEGWLGVTAVTVNEQHRRSGIGRHLMGELARWGARASNPAKWVYLQVDLANGPALAMYRKLGFTEHHRYHYLAAPTG